METVAFLDLIIRKIGWLIIAQCDLFAVEKLIETNDRPAMKTVAKMNSTIFEKKIERCHVCKDVFEKVCSAYECLQPSFKIVHDNFAGYRLLYTGLDIFKPQTVFKTNPVGFLKTVPEGAVSNLSVMSSQRTGETLLLMGPIRFVNSDCLPNAEFDFSGDSGIVKFKTKKKTSARETKYL